VPLLSDGSRRKRNLLLLAAFLLLTGAATTFDLGLGASELTVASNIVVVALLNLNLIVFLLLLVLLVRNLVKLYFERRRNVIGAHFKAKLVFTFLALAVAPSFLIFIIASNFINRSIEGWFKPQVERPLDQALVVAQAYYRHLESTALRHGQGMARTLAREGLLAPDRGPALRAYLLEQQTVLGFSSVTVFDASGRSRGHVQEALLADLPLDDINPSQLRQGLAGTDVTTVRELTTGDLVEAVAPVWSGQPRQVVGAVVVGLHVPERLEAKVRGISQAFQEYMQLKILKRPIKGSYILLFLLMTLIVVFSATWFGLYLARGLTGPIEQLAEGTREVAAGNFSYKVEARADDEIGVLVDSFNRMTTDLSESKRRLEEAYLDLQDKHTEIEDRRRYIEIVLEAITTGVVSFDPEGRVTTLNRAAARMFGVSATASVGRPVADVFAAVDAREVVELVQRTRRPQSSTNARELHLRRAGATVSLLASATAIRGPEGEYAGAVAVFDDLTELLRAQRVAAWREVAQRIAHEIKNPLTPIQLSAQRLRRRLGRSPEEEPLVRECTDTIVHEVEALRRLVDEFSRFARMPVLVRRPTDLRTLVDGVAGLYRGAHPGLSLTVTHAADLPSVDGDADHLKRAIQNLVDNAVAAVGGTGEITVETRSLDRPERVQLVVGDSGPGIRAEDREKLFLPYFSTKAAGTGLGLAIVQEIVTEHGGTVRAEDNRPRGSRFIVELPVARTPAVVEA
jgi:two-component system nitrogen regulation sensor histidine kinase NtrY